MKQAKLQIEILGEKFTLIKSELLRSGEDYEFTLTDGHGSRVVISTHPNCGIFTKLRYLAIDTLRQETDKARIYKRKG